LRATGQEQAYRGPPTDYPGVFQDTSGHLFATPTSIR
jgi:hypothetical protein